MAQEDAQIVHAAETAVTAQAARTAARPKKLPGRGREPPA